MKFYSVQIKANVEVPDGDIEIVTMANGKKAARATVEQDGKTLKLFKFLPADAAPAADAPAAKPATKAAAAKTPASKSSSKTSTSKKG